MFIDPQWYTPIIKFIGQVCRFFGRSDQDLRIVRFLFWSNGITSMVSIQSLNIEKVLYIFVSKKSLNIRHAFLHSIFYTFLLPSWIPCKNAHRWRLANWLKDVNQWDWTSSIWSLISTSKKESSSKHVKSVGTICKFVLRGKSGKFATHWRDRYTGNNWLFTIQCAMGND